jgi:hypothetical protein
LKNAPNSEFQQNNSCGCEVETCFAPTADIQYAALRRQTRQFAPAVGGAPRALSKSVFGNPTLLVKAEIHFLLFVAARAGPGAAAASVRNTGAIYFHVFLVKWLK